MFIAFSKEAVLKLSPYLHKSDAMLKLLHDTEGCGCVMSGVPALTLVSEATVDDREAQGDPFPFLYEPRHEVFYEPHMRVHYNEATGSFELRSDSQIYTISLRFINAVASS